MSYEERKSAYIAKAKTLADVPKDLKYFSKFNTLKMAVMEKVEADIKSGKINKEDSVTELVFAHKSEGVRQEIQCVRPAKHGEGYWMPVRKAIS